MMGQQSNHPTDPNYTPSSGAAVACVVLVAAFLAGVTLGTGIVVALGWYLSH